MDQSVKTDNIVTSIPLPSADLITYRFDQTDKKFDDLNLKLDKLTNNFASKEELQYVKEEADKTFANYRWYWRSIFTALLLCIGGIIAALIERK